MKIQHESRNGKIYYLHALPGKNDKPKYHFSTRADGPLADQVPDGYEIYENISGQVFLRRKTPQLITDEELALVNANLQRETRDHFYQAEVKKKFIIIYEASNHSPMLKSIALSWINPDAIRKAALLATSFMAVLRFLLVEPEKRLFIAERYCFRGSVEDWIDIGCRPAPLPKVLKKYLPHLGKESMYELY